MGTSTPREFTDDEVAHIFTPQEASRLLPDIKIRFKEIIERKKVADSLKSEIEHFNLMGYEVPEATEASKELDCVVKDLMKMIGEIEDLGVVIRDIDTGLVDFPALRFGEKVCLCWKYGESGIEYWHTQGEGFQGRKPLKVQPISR